LSYYFTLAGAVSSDYSFEGNDGAGNQIRVTSNSGVVELEILAENSASDWTLFKISSTAAIGYSFTAGDAAWKCSHHDSAEGTADDANVSTAGQDLYSKVGSEGTESAVYIKISGFLVGVAVSKNGITNFAGYAATSFAFGPSTFTSFKSNLPALPAAEQCDAAKPASADTVVESATQPICGSFPSLFAFLAERVYNAVSSNTWCSTTSATYTSCSATVAKTDSWGGLSATDRILKCRNNSFGTIIVFSGTTPTEILDWVRNASILSTYNSQMKLYVHNGFKYKYDMWSATVDSYVGTYNSATNAATSNKITFAGHSLGGAMAQIGGADYNSITTVNWSVRVVTFGAPTPFKPPSSGWPASWTSTPHSRYVNYYADFCLWGACTISQRDMVSAITEIAGFSWSSNSNSIQANTKTLLFGYNTDNPPVIPFVSDQLIPTVFLHMGYPAYTDAARGDQTSLVYS